MRLLFTGLLISCCMVSQAQQSYTYVDSKVLQIPQAETYGTASIAGYILDHFTTDREKIRAAYTWVTHNIEYSKDSMYYFRAWGVDPEINMSAILRRRKGVCENYAALFANIVSKCGVQAVMITGYTNTGNRVDPSGHAWCAVQAGDEWLLCDPTWDAGKDSYSYFLVEPFEFISTHMPFDPLWQLLEHLVTHQQFRSGYTGQGKDTPVFYYKDSVAAYLMADRVQQMESVSRRIQQWGIHNEDVSIWQRYYQMKLQIVYQEENMQWYNDAVASLNTAKQLFNEFVEYRNSRFATAKPETAISNLFSSIEKHLYTANKKLEQVGKKAENYQYDTESLKINLHQLSARVKQQQEFWEQYLAADETTRKKML